MEQMNEFQRLVEKYLNNHGIEHLQILSDTCETSRNTEGNQYLCHARVPVIDMDKIAQHAYRKIMMPESTAIHDSISSADAFLIRADREWYYIEYKDQRLSNTEYKKIIKKALESILMLIDILYKVRKSGDSHSEFDYNDPIGFIRKKVNYIVVFNHEKDPYATNQVQNYKMKKSNYVPDFMRKLDAYWFKSAYVLTEEAFEHNFLASRR